MNNYAFSLVTGALALVSAVASILCYYYSRLPSQRMEAFDKIFGHSKELFARAKENGLITTSLQWSISSMIARLEASSLEARTRVYCSSQGLGAYVMRRELSQDVGVLVGEAEALRLSITISAQQQLKFQSLWRVGGDRAGCV